MSGSGWHTDRRGALAMTAGAAMLPLQAKRAQAATAKSGQGFGRDLPFDADWRFLRGAPDGAERPAFPDAQWRRVDLPHDWSVEDLPQGQAPDQVGPFDRHAPGKTGTGFTVGGEGWYRKHFRVDGYPADSLIEITFDGAYLEVEAWLNGQPLGRNVHGYIPFAFDLTPHLDRAGDNVLAVRVRNLGENSRWYSGSGLYRQVTLDVLPATTRIARWGVGAWTRRIEAGLAEIDVTTALAGFPSAAGQGASELVTRLRDSHGTVVATGTSPAAAEVKQTLVLRNPALWSPDQPNLYTLETELRGSGRTIDRLAQPFGVRIVRFDPQDGMTINGVRTNLFGGCIHHDNGLLGAKAFPDADDRRIRLLRARGYNAIRSSHNPSSRSLREACERHGMLMIEEAFDVWHDQKLPQDFHLSFAEHWEEVIRAMVLPARNSPAVIMWSIGNEIPSRATSDGVRWQWTLANAVKRLDPTRPVTAGLNGVLGQELIAGEGTARTGQAGKRDNASTVFLDVPGYNYRLTELQREFATHPERVVYASETFARNMFDYAGLMRRQPSFLGEFVWTAMDYIGEAGLGATAFLKKDGPPYYLANWPWVNAWCGDLDLIGQQKPPSLARDVAWGVSPLEMTVQRPVPEGSAAWIANWGWPDDLASWTWPGSEGKRLTVKLYSSGDRIELRLNGRVVGSKALAPADQMQAALEVPYAPGVLEAVAYQGSREVARRRLATVGAAAALRLKPERATIPAGRQALAFVPVEIVDSRGDVLPDDKRQVHLTIRGPAELVAFGSANPLATGSLQAPHAETFRGRGLAILRSTGAAGPVQLEAQTAGLQAARTRLRFT